MRKLAGCALALVIGLVLAGCGSSSPSGGSKSSSSTGSSQQFSASHPLKVAFILGGSPTDGGFYAAIYQGIQQVQKIGPQVKVTYKVNVPESPQSVQVIEGLVQDGNNLIFGTTFGYHTFLAQEAKKHPNVKFEQWEATELGPNLNEYEFGIEQSWYLAGMAAGATTKTNKIGVVGSFPIPGLLKQVNGLALGARSVNPNANVQVVWMNSFFDPAKETQAAQSLASSGRDVLVTAMDSPAVGQVAEKANLPYIGHDLDQRSFAPKAWMTGAEFVFGPYFERQVRAAAGGTWQGNQSYYGLLKDGVTALAPFGDRYQTAVPQKIRDDITSKEQAFKDGSFDVFTGPISDQSGKVRIAAGQKASVADLKQINYLVQGITGSVGGAG